MSYLDAVKRLLDKYQCSDPDNDNDDYYLSMLENDDRIQNAREIPRRYIRSTPKTSSFYWVNRSGWKYKVFINTPERELYLNLEEYNRNDIVNGYTDENWRNARKCVLLSLLPNNDEDKCIWKQLISLMKKIKYRPDESDFDQLEYLDVRKYYVLKIYDVDRIENVPLDERYKHVKYEKELYIDYSLDQDLLEDLDKMFTLSARRFVNDRDREVYEYSYRSQGYFA